MSLEELRKKLIDLVSEVCVKKLEEEFKGKDVKVVFEYALNYAEGMKISSGIAPACAVVIEYVRGMFEAAE